MAYYKGNRALAGATVILLLLGSITGCTGSTKPEKAEVQAGLAKLYESSPALRSLGKPAITKITTCITDNSYNKISAKSLEKIVKGEELTDTKNPDYTVLFKAAQKCAANISNYQPTKK